MLLNLDGDDLREDIPLLAPLNQRGLFKSRRRHHERPHAAGKTAMVVGRMNVPEGCELPVDDLVDWNAARGKARNYISTCEQLPCFDSIESSDHKSSLVCYFNGLASLETRCGMAYRIPPQLGKRNSHLASTLRSRVLCFGTPHVALACPNAYSDSVSGSFAKLTATDRCRLGTIQTGHHIPTSYLPVDFAMKFLAVFLSTLVAASAFAPVPAGRTSTQINESLFDKVRRERTVILVVE